VDRVVLWRDAASGLQAILVIVLRMRSRAACARTAGA
jgi:hypothetical protein